MGFDEEQDLWQKEILPKLEKDCKPFLKEKTLLYRGFGRRFDFEFIIPRKDRRPLDSPQWFHDGFDNASKKVFGWKSRSEGVFASSTYSTASAYAGSGTVAMVFPKGKFKYIWSSKINDLFDELNDEDFSIFDDETAWVQFVKQNYQDNNLRSVRNENTEIMLYCPNGYYAVDVAFDEAVKKVLL